MNDTDEWRAAVQESNAAPRPEPDEYAGSADGPSNAVYSATDDVAKAMRWGAIPLCDDCGEEVRHAWDALCGSCMDDRLDEEKHDRSMAGEW